MKTKNHLRAVSTNAEEILNFFLVLSLIVGIIGGLYILFEEEALTGVLFILGCLVLWASVKVIINISYRLKNIQDILMNANGVIEESDTKKPVTKAKSGDNIAKKQNGHTNSVAVGDTIILLSNGRKYEVKNANEDRVCIYKGLVDGYVWLTTEEFKTV